jgi:hypothetical protein
LMIWMPSLAKAASKSRVNLLSPAFKRSTRKSGRFCVVTVLLR